MRKLISKSALTSLALCLSWLAWSGTAQVVYIDVQGLTCPFCVYGLAKNLGKVTGVAKAEVNLDEHRARIELKPGQQPDVEQYRQIIRDAGFTPGKAYVHGEEGKP